MKPRTKANVTHLGQQAHVVGKYLIELVFRPQRSTYSVNALLCDTVEI